MRTFKVDANAVHEAFYQEVCLVLKKYEERYKLPGEEILAIMSNMVGKLLANLDQTKFTEAAGMEVVCKNLEMGNQQVLDALLERTAGNA
jgi:hypothetical protein